VDLLSKDAYTGHGKIVVQQGGQTRRQILKVALGGAAGLVLGAPVRLVAEASAQAAAQGASIQRLSDDLFVVRLPGEANVVAHTGAQGVLLVDGGSASAADALMKTVAGLPGAGPVHTLVNTHWHPEQTGSNEALGKAGKAIIAHENTRLWLTTDVTWPWNGRRFTRLPKIAQPNKTFYTTGTLGSGVRYGYIPDAAHTDGDMYVLFPTQNVLVAGDVVSGEGWPVVDWTTGGWIGGIVGGLQRLQTLANEETRIVPGRGPVLGLADLKAQYEMYGTIHDRLTQLLNKGRGPGEAVAARPTQEFDAQMGNPDEFVRRAFESLWAYLSPDA
jgi:cyclase